MLALYNFLLFNFPKEKERERKKYIKKERERKERGF